MSLINEYIQKGLSGNDLENELKRLIVRYNELRGTYLVVYAAAMGKPIPNLPISFTMEDYYIINDILRDKSGDKLDIYIETPGGSGEAAEETVRLVHKKFKSVSFVISGEAKSAGTIMVLSGNEILMTESGSLGPIDAQMVIGRSQISAYDYMHWVNQKHAEAEKHGRLNPLDATMIAQISPGELTGVDNALNYAKDLVKEWLPKYKFADWNTTESNGKKVTDQMKAKRAEEIVNELVDHNKWRSHGRSLKLEDMEQIGLKITHVDINPELADVVYRIQAVLKMLFNSTTSYKGYVTADQKIFVQASSGNIPMPTPAQINKPDVVQLQLGCPRCGTIHSLYAKFKKDPKIDEDMTSAGFNPLPKDNKIKCNCGFEIDTVGPRNEIETQIGQKVVL